MRRKITVGFLIWICFLLQSTVFQGIAFNGIVPNLLIVLTASFGFMRGEKEGLLIGFFCGLLCDIYFGDVIGFYSLVMMYIGFLNGKFSSGFYPEDIKLPLALIRERFVLQHYMLHMHVSASRKAGFFLFFSPCHPAGSSIYNDSDSPFVSVYSVCQCTVGE